LRGLETHSARTFLGLQVAIILVKYILELNGYKNLCKQHGKMGGNANELYQKTFESTVSEFTGICTREVM